MIAWTECPDGQCNRQRDGTMWSGMFGTVMAACVWLAAADSSAVAATAATGSLDTAYKLYQAQDYAGALAIWRPLAEQNDPNALFNLGQAYRLGRGVPADPKQAVTYYERAAKLGHIAAQGNLATLYYFGPPGTKDSKKAIEWFQAAARNGDARAQYMLGVLYFNGDELPKDWPRAYAYTTLARDAGLVEANDSLAQLNKYLQPTDVEQGKALWTQLVQATPTLPNSRPVIAASAPAAPPPVPAQAPALQTAAATTSNATPATALPTVYDGRRPETTKTAAAAPPPAVPIAPAPAPAPTSAPAPTATAKPVVKAAVQAHHAPAPAPTKVASNAPAPANAGAAGGGWRVQLGAYGSATGAQGEWSHMKAAVQSVISGAEPVMTTTANITRLQVGSYTSAAEAGRACQSLKAKGLSCFPAHAAP